MENFFHYILLFHFYFEFLLFIKLECWVCVFGAVYQYVGTCTKWKLTKQTSDWKYNKKKLRTHLNLNLNLMLGLNRYVSLHFARLLLLKTSTIYSLVFSFNWCFLFLSIVSMVVFGVICALQSSLWWPQKRSEQRPHLRSVR